MRNVLAVFFAVLLGFGCATKSSSPFMHLTETLPDGTITTDQITFEPIAKAGFGGDIVEAKADMTMVIKNPDGYSYELTTGQNAKGISNLGQVEMFNAFTQGMFQALPGMVDAAVGAILGKANIDAQKPQGMSNQDFLLQLVDKATAAQANRNVNVKVTP